jgi:hypothetical protein
MTSLKQTLAMLAAICLISVLFTACGKKTSDDPDPDGSSTTSTSYQPLSVNSNWTYLTDYPTADNVVLTATASTQTFNKKAYTVVQAKGAKLGTQNQYFYNANHLYNYRVPVDGLGTIDFTYLNDNAAANATWTANVTDDGTLNGIPARMTGTIAEKDVTKTVSGKKYTDVIHTTVLLQYQLIAPTYTTLATYDFYVAKGIGIVEMDSNTYGVTSTLKLQSYQIK